MSGLITRGGFRSLCLLLLTLIAAALISTSLTRAAGPAADPASAADSLLASLSDAQRAALQAKLAAYEEEFATLAAQLAAVMPTSEAGRERLFLPLLAATSSAAALTGEAEAATAARPADATIDAALDKVVPGMISLRASLEADLASILSPQQMALYRAALAAAPVASAEAAPSGGTLQQSETNALVCFTSAQWANYGFAFITSAKAFAIMSAFNVDFGTESPEAVQSYISYNAAEAYARDGLQRLSTASVMLTAADLQVQNINGGTYFGNEGNVAMERADFLNTDGLENALLDYTNSGGVIVAGVGIGGNYFSYFAYAYGEIASFYLNGSLERTPACF